MGDIYTPPISLWIRAVQNWSWKPKASGDMSESHMKENATSNRINCYGGTGTPLYRLMLYGNLVDQKSKKEHEIIERQLAMNR